MEDGPLKWPMFCVPQSPPTWADESPEAASNDNLPGRAFSPLSGAPHFANSSRFHPSPRRSLAKAGPLHSSAASDQRHRPALPFRAVTPSQIVEDRQPRRRERGSCRQVPSAGRPRIRALPKPSALTTPPKPVRPLAFRASRWSHACPPATKATAPSHPGRQKSEHRALAPRPGPAALISSAPTCRRDC